MTTFLYPVLTFAIFQTKSFIGINWTVCKTKTTKICIQGILLSHEIKSRVNFIGNCVVLWHNNSNCRNITNFILQIAKVEFQNGKATNHRIQYVYKNSVFIWEWKKWSSKKLIGSPGWLVERVTLTAFLASYWLSNTVELKKTSNNSDLLHFPTKYCAYLT